MKEPAYKGKEPLPLSVYVSARAGDPQAVERLLRYYDNYMNCLCTRTLYDEDGYPHLCVDEYMKRCLEIRLIKLSLKFNDNRPAGCSGLPFPRQQRSVVSQFFEKYARI